MHLYVSIALVGCKTAPSSGKFHFHWDSLALRHLPRLLLPFGGSEKVQILLLILCLTAFRCNILRNTFQNLSQGDPAKYLSV